MSRGLYKELALLTGLTSVGLLLLGKKSWGAALGLGCAGFALLPTENYSFRNRVAVITGGSRGLGLALAKELVHQGASIAILARDTIELERAKQHLASISSDAKVLAVRCDITQDEELQQAFNQIESHYGRLDLLINNAGSIAVGPFETMGQADFDSQLNLQIHAVIQAVRLAIPAFRRVGSGRIVNISSIGGIIPVPHMSTYCTAKFALAGLSESIASELALDNIKVTTVYPGLMRTGSPIQAVFKGNHEKEYAWFASGDVTPGLSVAANEAAHLILEGVRQGNARVTYPLITKIGIIGHAVLPETYAFIMRSAARFMPKSSVTLRKTGAESKHWLDRQLWYKPLKKMQHNAEQEYNQVDKYDAKYNLGLTHSLAEPSYSI